MFKFNITYHYHKYHTGELDERLKRTMSVYASDLDKAVEKVRTADKNYLCMADNGVIAEEILWWALCFPELMTVDTKTAWSKMPKEMEEYIRSLPEFNEKIFNEITGRN